MATPERALRENADDGKTSPKQGGSDVARETVSKGDGQGIDRDSSQDSAKRRLLGEYMTVGKGPGPEAVANDNRTPFTDASLPEFTISSDGNGEKVRAAETALERVRPGVERLLDANSLGKAGDRAEYNFYKLMTDARTGIMPEMRQSEALGKEWALYPTQSLSPLDKVGGGFILFNKESGDFYLIDATTNENKKNRYALREEGIIQMDNRLFDQSGALVTDSDNPATREKAEGFRQGMKDLIKDLTSKPSPFRVGDTPMLSAKVVNPETTKAQIEGLSKWASDKAQGLSGYDREAHLEMGREVKKPVFQQEMTKIEADSPSLKDRAKAIAREEVLRYIFEGPQNYQPSNGGTRKSDVRLLEKDGGIRYQHDGQNLNGGTTGEAIQSALSELNKPGELLGRLNNKQLESLGVDITDFKRLRGDERVEAIKKQASRPDLRKAQDKMRDRMNEYGRYAGVEGRFGAGKPLLREAIMNRLRGSESYMLTGEEPPVAKPEKPIVSEPVRELSAQEKSALGKDGVQDLTRYYRETGGNAPGRGYSEDAHLALMEMEPKDSWRDKQKAELSRLQEGYAAKDAKVIAEVHELLKPQVVDGNSVRISERGQPIGMPERSSNGADKAALGEGVLSTGIDHSSNVLTDGALPRPVDVNVLVTSFNADGTTKVESKPLATLSHEQMARKFENIDQKIAEAARSGNVDATHELMRYKDEYAKRSPKERLELFEQIKREAREVGSDRGSGAGGKFARSSSAAVAIMMLFDFALSNSARAAEAHPERVVPKGN